MKLSKDVELIEYPPKIEKANMVTHAVAAVFALAALILSLVKVIDKGPRFIISAAVYCLAFFGVYTISAVYHGLPAGEAKRTARLFDHIAIPLLLAGTATPCALITLYRVDYFHCALVFSIAWFSALFGIVSKLFFFSNKTAKILCMVVYFAGGAIMMLSNITILDEINKTAFILLIIGCLLYTLGAVFCSLGIKHPAFHPVFHILVFLASAVIFLSIYNYIF